ERDCAPLPRRPRRHATASRPPRRHSRARRCRGGRLTMNPRCAFALVLFLTYPASGAEENPSGIRVITDQRADGVTLSVTSKYASEFTVTLEAIFENMTPSRPVPFTV